MRKRKWWPLTPLLRHFDGFEVLKLKCLLFLVWGRSLSRVRNRYLIDRMLLGRDVKEERRRSERTMRVLAH